MSVLYDQNFDQKLLNVIVYECYKVCLNMDFHVVKQLEEQS